MDFLRAKNDVFDVLHDMILTGTWYHGMTWKGFIQRKIRVTLRPRGAEDTNEDEDEYKNEDMI